MLHAFSMNASVFAARGPLDGLFFNVDYSGDVGRRLLLDMILTRRRPCIGDPVRWHFETMLIKHYHKIKKNIGRITVPELV